MSKIRSYDTVLKGLFYGVFGVSKVVSELIVIRPRINDTLKRALFNPNQ